MGYEDKGAARNVDAEGTLLSVDMTGPIFGAQSLTTKRESDMSVRSTEKCFNYLKLRYE